MEMQTRIRRLTTVKMLYQSARIREAMLLSRMVLPMEAHTPDFMHCSCEVHCEWAARFHPALRVWIQAGRGERGEGWETGPGLAMAWALSAQMPPFTVLSQGPSSPATRASQNLCLQLRSRKRTQRVTPPLPQWAAVPSAQLALNIYFWKGKEYLNLPPR